MPGTDTLAFARSMEEGEFWICILEKAWAKLHGSYSMVVGGTPNQVFPMFLPSATEYIAHGIKEGMHSSVDASSLWYKIKRVAHFDCIATASSGTHSYALLDG